MKAPGDVTKLLRQYGGGDKQALDAIVPLLYRELRRVAGNILKSERSGHTLQPTALVNEAFLALRKQDKIGIENRAHFFATAARLMRWILIDHAKAKRRKKRGGGGVRVSFDEAFHVPEADRDAGADLLAVDRALKHLATIDERKAQVVELRFFGGLGVEETGEALGISPASVKRDWTVARAWLYRELKKEE